ncbi:TPA: hypothetical protein SLU74_001867 [Pseudomonas aeruginosa]|uniref:hypothetical protein n=1 Tax=Pseudomonas aeruginosa TaxID=287 RepID=UPI00177FC107|nr:hypothetical protein [Pseudomonas aeruginosa]MBG6404224.1 hypothetical protein [Pseudomonas aeruginosa]MBH4125899.1 hypothetical protein [Pseudomonas aeruginosa]MBH4248647.1 hypothetical protein [Pseudomonas aeruginosa]MBI7997272.1 hypothetical protein [Pseudomonas aeruginosa]MCS7543306.1 hypothetical protein [Pseudomonas aeruginosa]
MRPVSNRLHAGPPHAADNPSVAGNHAGDVRGVGRVGAIERATNKTTGQAFAQPDVLGGYLFKQAHQHVLIIRALYDTIACWLTRRTGPGHRTFCKQKQEPGVLNHA